MESHHANRAELNALVVDDEELVRKLVSAALKGLGVEKIETADDGRAAIEIVQARQNSGNPFNLIVCDWEMPVMDGIDFLEKFRADNLDAIFIMVTARTATEDFNKAKKKGVDYFFMKPLQADMLRIRLDSAIDAAIQRRQKAL